MNIVICEDDEVYRSYIHSVLDEHIKQQGYNTTIVLDTDNPNDVMDYIETNSVITIYYLDIKLTQTTSGFDVAEKIRQKDYLSHIVFITNYGEMMPLTYEYKLEALDYIVKSNSDNVRQKLCESLDFVEERQKNGYVRCLNIHNKQKNFSIPFDEVCYIESIKSSHKLELYYDHGMFTFYGLLKDVESQLDNRFLRCHKSIIVNKDKIIAIDKQQRILKLTPGYECIYSAKYKEMIEL